MKKLYLLSIIVLFGLNLRAQLFEISTAPIFRDENASVLSLALAGGLNQPQFSPYDFNQDGNTQTNNTTTEFSWENTSPGPDFNSLSYTYNNSTTNQQTGVVSTNAFIWDFAEDYNSAVTTTEAGVINNWIRK